MRKGCLVFRVTCLVKWSKTIHIKSRTLVQWLSEYRLMHSITYKRLMIEASSENQKQAIKTSLINLALFPPQPSRTRILPVVQMGKIWYFS